MTYSSRTLGTLGLLLTLIAAMPACVGDATRDPYEAVTHNPIPRQNQERALLVDSKTSANSALIASTFGPTEAADALSAGMEKRWGLDVAPPSFKDVTPIRILVTKKYNVTETSYSVLRAEVYAFPGKVAEKLSIVSAFRWDDWKAWGKEFHTGLPVPFKTWNNTPVVTEGELRWLRDTLEQRGATTAFVLRGEWGSGIDDNKLLARLYADLMARAKTTP